MANRTILTVIFTLFTASFAAAQQYELGWDQVHKAPQASPAKSYTLDWESVGQHVDRAEPSLEPIEELRVPEAIVAAAVPRRAISPPERLVEAPPRPQPAPTYNVELSTSQFYDHYAGRYKKVSRVEVTTYHGGGRYFSQIFENRGQWNTYPVYLNRLKEGERFLVRVVWDDGSNRTIDKTVNGSTESVIHVGQPDFLAYNAP